MSVVSPDSCRTGLLMLSMDRLDNHPEFECFLAFHRRVEERSEPYCNLHGYQTGAEYL
jgi:hypothetical protein